MPSSQSTLVDRDACRSCPHHRSQGSGCRVVEGAEAIALDDFLAREHCYLVERLEHFAARCAAHRPRLTLEARDLVQEAVAHLLASPQRRAGGFAAGLRPFLAYLKRTVWSCAISHERKELGRLRCGSCARFAPYSEVCLAPGHAWTHAHLAPAQDPRRLAPPCERFAPLRLPEALQDDLPARARASDARAPEHEAVHEALLELAAANPRAALVLRARCLEGRTYAELAALGFSHRTLKRDFAQGLAFLRERLRCLRPEPRVREASAGARTRLPLGSPRDVSLPRG